MVEYKVLDPNGVAYSSESGREVIACGGVIPERLIQLNYFTPAGIQALIENGRIKLMGKVPIESPSNRKAEIPSAKGRGKK